ncbi:hypothetical protein HH303_15330 [Rhodospirillaceae bacterium KN72]|uniref:Uncharacterized protein n=1 Tax=Pacificispira spongiicola TaxID=2729598 RepID=A0A7Y0E268_9PROT|nr:hypothetical protein [Pacificispira spongiicola]NMM45868.1 hypothetical protein [Pacificispira spongiicola]
MNNKTQPMAIPMKFRNPETGELNSDALLRSYLELEKKLGAGGVPPSATSGPASADFPEQEEPTPEQAELKALGVPETPEQYRIEILEDFLERDPELEAVLHRAGFTEEQAQLVYDLAAEKLAPLMISVVQAARGSGDQSRLETEFGGADRWKEMRRQMRKWGERNLPPGAVEHLASSYDGVMAIHRMMSAGDEPGIAKGGEGGEGLSEQQLKRLMMDPRYWRDRDPSLVGKVQSGFRQLYPTGN